MTALSNALVRALSTGTHLALASASTACVAFRPLPSRPASAGVMTRALRREAPVLRNCCPRRRAATAPHKWLHMTASVRTPCKVCSARYLLVRILAASSIGCTGARQIVVPRSDGRQSVRRYGSSLIDAHECASRPPSALSISAHELEIYRQCLVRNLVAFTKSRERDGSASDTLVSVVSVVCRRDG